MRLPRAMPCPYCCFAKCRFAAAHKCSTDGTGRGPDPATDDRLTAFTAASGGAQGLTSATAGGREGGEESERSDGQQEGEGPPGLVLDVGANFGWFALYAAAMVGLVFCCFGRYTSSTVLFLTHMACHTRYTTAGGGICTVAHILPRCPFPGAHASTLYFLSRPHMTGLPCDCVGASADIQGVPGVQCGPQRPVSLD